MLDGLAERTDGTRAGELRVPEALAGFTLRVGEGSWWVDGEEATDGTLCARCERGRRLAIEVRGASEAPVVRIADRGYPDVAGRTSVAAAEWLRALEGDNRRYRELAGS